MVKGRVEVGMGGGWVGLLGRVHGDGKGERGLGRRWGCAIVVGVMLVGSFARIARWSFLTLVDLVSKRQKLTYTGWCQKSPSSGLKPGAQLLQ